MNIIIENGSYHMKNLGDVAMLKVAINRCREFYPKAKIYVTTDDQELLFTEFPDVIPVEISYKQSWFNTRIIPIPLKFIPKFIQLKLMCLEKKIEITYPIIAFYMKGLLSKLNGKSYEVKSFSEIIKGADILISCGGGLINDFSVNYSLELLDTFAIAQSLGKRTGMFGLGLGPVSNQELLKK